MSQQPAIIEIDGVKITPEFVEVLKRYINFERKTVGDIKNDLFFVSNLLVTMSNDENVLINARKIGDSMYSVYSFFNEIEELLQDGKL